MDSIRFIFVSSILSKRNFHARIELAVTGGYGSFNVLWLGQMFDSSPPGAGLQWLVLEFYMILVL